MLPIPVDNHLRHAACPVCRSPEIFGMGPLDYGGKAKFSSCEVELARVPELWRCRQCACSFVQNAIDEATARELYTSGEAGDRWSTQLFSRSKTALVVHSMQALFSPGTRVLDVGANTGELLDFARQEGCATTGLEYSEKSRDALRSKGHAAYASFDEAAGAYDVITAFDLIEHLYDVPAFLDTCHARLSDRGRLVLLTGDIHAPSARLAGTHWWYVQYPEHIVFPSRQYLTGLSKFRVEALRRTYASIGYQRSGLLGVAQYLRRQLQGRCYNGLPSLGPDHMLVILKKVEAWGHD